MNKEIKKINLLKHYFQMSSIFPKSITILYTLFQKNHFPSEKWHELVRECLFYEKQDIVYLTGRVFLLLNRYCKSIGSFLETNNSNNSPILPRLHLIIKLLELHNELLFEIYPRMKNSMTYNVYEIDKFDKQSRRNINWKKTLISSNNTFYHPLYFVSKTNLFDYGTSENLILLLSINKLQNDAIYIKSQNFIEPLSKNEVDVLNNIIRRCSVVIKEPIIQSIYHLGVKLFSLELNNELIKILEKDFKYRLINKDISNLNYNKLFIWFKKYSNYNLRNITPRLNNYIITKRENLDSMFELYILLELINYLEDKENANVRQMAFNKGFIIEISGKEFHIYYEKEYKKKEYGWALNSEPDFSIEVKGKLKIIMDAKNWLNESYNDAKYKMLGYLNNLDGTLGVLFFPIKKPSSLDYLESEMPSFQLKNHINQCLVQCVIPFRMPDKMVSIKNETLEKLTNIILREILE